MTVYQTTGFAVPDELEVLHDLLAQVAQEHPEIGATDLMLFETAVIEIAGNVVEHGRPEGAVSWKFSLEVSETALRAVLADSGEAFSGDIDSSTLPADPFADSGRGFSLASAALDELDYERVADGNRWLMRRTLRH